jgi:hypothetical protein
MDFEKVLPLIIDEFKKEKVRYALIGGFSMGTIGIMRSTMDLDFLVDAKDLAKIEKIMKKYSYNRVYKTADVSQYVAEAKIFGEIDFLHAFREISLSMLKRAKIIEVFQGACRLKVLAPEDIIGLKVQAAANNPDRKQREFADIESIMSHLKKLKLDRIQEYFKLFSMEKEFNKLKKKYGDSD